MVFRNANSWAMDARWQDKTHRIELNGKLDYHGPLFSAQLDPETFDPVQIDATASASIGDELSLEPVAVMYALLNGLRNSLPYLPSALPAGFIDTGKIPHSDYLE